MGLVSKNVPLGRPTELSSWRKLAINAWLSPTDPSVYAILDIDASRALEYTEKLTSETGQRVTLTDFVVRAIAVAIARNPEINAVLRWGILYPREAVDIYLPIATDMQGRDLSGITIRNADRKSIVEIAREVQAEVKGIRRNGDPGRKRMNYMMALIPSSFVRLSVRLTAFVMHTLNLWSPLLGAPRDAFGSAMVTNVGAFGIHTAFAPIVPYSRLPLVIALGSVEDQPVVRDGHVTVAPMVRLCVTIDHRLVDGVHSAKMAKVLKRIFRNPEREPR